MQSFSRPFRGFDLANLTVIEGDEGIIVIDPLSGTETAQASLDLYRAHRGDRPVKALIYTHSHADHYGGSRAVVEGQTDVAVIAPEGRCRLRHRGLCEPSPVSCRSYAGASTGWDGVPWPA